MNTIPFPGLRQNEKKQIAQPVAVSETVTRATGTDAIPLSIGLAADQCLDRRAPVFQVHFVS